jgi:hypothetical protein
MIGEQTVEAVVRRMQSRLDDLPPAHQLRLAELELLSAAKISDLLASGQVVLRLAVAGFGVMLPPAVRR